MKFIDSSGVIFECPVTFAGGVTPELSLGNIDSLDISGNVVAAGSGQFGGDVGVGDDLAVVDDATIGGDLTVTGGLTVGGDAELSGNLSLTTGEMTVGGAFRGFAAGQFDSGFTAFGASTLQATECTTLDASGAVLCGSTLGVTGAVTCASTLAVAGTSTIHNTVVIGTLSVSSTSTLAATTATALTASSSLTLTGANVVGLHDYVTLRIDNLQGTGVYRVASPVAGTLVKVWSNLHAALTTGDATLTGRIGSTAITNGALTITQSGSAAGDIDSCTPTAQNVVVEGSDINFTVGGTNASAVACTLTLKFLRSA